MTDKANIINAGGVDYPIEDTAATTHIANRENPHNVTAAQIGLGIVVKTFEQLKSALGTAQTSPIVLANDITCTATIQVTTNQLNLDGYSLIGSGDHVGFKQNNGTTFTVSGGTFKNFSNPSDWAGVFQVANGQTLVAEDCVFDNCTAATGGVIQDNGAATFVRCTFNGCKAVDGNGGAVVIGAGALTLTDCACYGCTSAGGNIIGTYNDNHTQTNVKYVKCHVNGGGILVGYQDKTMTLNNVEIRACTADGDCAGLSTSGKVIANGLKITDCYAASGYAGLNAGASTASVELQGECVITGNRVAGQSMPCDATFKNLKLAGKLTGTVYIAGTQVVDGQFGTATSGAEFADGFKHEGTDASGGLVRLKGRIESDDEGNLILKWSDDPITDAGAVRIAQGDENLCKYVITDGNANVTVSDVLGIKIENFDDLKGYLERPRSLPLILNADITATEQIRAATNVLNLNGHNITSDGLSHRFINIQTNQTVSIYGDGKISEFNNTQHGGCIYVSDTAKLKLSHVVFDNCKVSNADIVGGCMYVLNGAVDATDCTFTNCKSENSLAGAVYLRLASTFIGRGCAFDTCSSYSGGGAIFGHSSETVLSVIKLLDCSFSSCTSQTGNGGGISSSGTTTVTDCSFSQCSANVNGGGIYSSNTSTITGCSFSQCSANVSGGGIYSSNTSTITGCNFSQCSANVNGGGIQYNTSSVITAVLTDCNFSQCSAKDGGGINVNCVSTVTDCSFNSCTATSSGGGIKIGGGSDSVWHMFKNITIYNCSAVRCGGMVNWSKLNLNGVKIQNCYANLDAGGFGSSIENSNLKISGGVIITNNYMGTNKYEYNCLFNKNVTLIGALTGECNIHGSPDDGDDFGTWIDGQALASNFKNEHVVDGTLKKFEGSAETTAEGEKKLIWRAVSS